VFCSSFIEAMRFCQRRYLACMSEALVVAQYLGLGAQRFGQFADLILIPNIGPPGRPQLISSLAKMHCRQSKLKIDPNVILEIIFDR
jgi:hypothetical protein